MVVGGLRQKIQKLFLAAQVAAQGFDEGDQPPFLLLGQGVGEAWHRRSGDAGDERAVQVGQVAATAERGLAQGQANLGDGGNINIYTVPVSAVTDAGSSVPPYYGVVWILRVKRIGRVALPRNRKMNGTRGNASLPRDWRRPGEMISL